MKKKLDMPQNRRERPVISFARNDVLQIPDNLLGQLYSAISRRKVIRFGYRKFQDAGKPFSEVTVYPYQLRLYNYRWFLVCNPVGTEEYPFNPVRLYTYALDRMDGNVAYVDELPYIDTPLDIDARYDEIVGITYLEQSEMQDIYFAVKPASVDYVRTKFIHPSQDEVNPATKKQFIRRYPTLGDCKFFIINCRPNPELLAVLNSYGENLIVLEPAWLRDAAKQSLTDALANYEKLNENP